MAANDIETRGEALPIVGTRVHARAAGAPAAPAGHSRGLQGSRLGLHENVLNWRLQSSAASNLWEI